MKFIEKIFSVKNKDNYKIVKILGIKIKLKNINAMQEQINNLKADNFTLESKFFHIKNSMLINMENPVFHYSAFTIDNAGDNILVDALRKSISLNSNKKINFISQNARHTLSDMDIYMINKSKCMIIGGGGLFLKDTNANQISGWQMPISAKQINNVNVPIYILGVGYNRFRNQDDFDNCFVENINTLVEKAAFAGIRNNGSIRALKKYLRDDLKNKLVFHPCATTILSKIYDIPKINKEDPFIAVECAFDREHLRYGKNKEKILNSISEAILNLSKKYKIKYYVHLQSDCNIFPYFDKLGIKYEVVYLNRALTEQDFLKLYSTPKLVIGMRGHAQMIPFGCGTPILSIISHDKLQWFLEDINHTEWGVDVISDNFKNELLEIAEYILKNNDLIKNQIEISKKSLYKTINRNIIKCVNLVSPPPYG